MIEWHTIFLIGHIVGVALGVGGATSSDLIFFRSLADGTLDRSELKLLRSMSMLIWCGLALLIASGIGILCLAHAENPTLGFIPSEKVAAKLSVVGILTLNGLVFATIIQPILDSLEGKRLTPALLRPHLSLILTCGAISVTSWYTALILGAIGRVDVSYGFVMGTYLGVLLSAILVAQFVGRWYLGHLTRSSGK